MRFAFATSPGVERRQLAIPQKRMAFVMFAVAALINVFSNAQDQQTDLDHKLDTIPSIESTRGGRHWVDKKTDAPKPPKASLSCFQLEPGLQIELVAAEPLVMDPVSIAFDEFGRMFVAEYGDYPTGPPNNDDPPLSRIVLLLDDDGDGQMDQRHVFADRLDFAHSMMPYREGILVCSQNEITFYKDTDGDHKADLREVFFRGFTPAHSQMQIGNPRWGMDNWIYFNQGPGQVENVRLENQSESSDDAAKLEVRFINMPRKEFRFHPVTMEFGPASGLGQFGNTIDNFGHRFFSTNRNPIMTAPISFEQLQRNPFVVSPQDHYDVAPSGGDSRVYPIVEMKSNYLSHSGTHTAACGTTAYRGDLLGPEFDNSVFVCEPIGHLVTRSMIESSGVTLTAKRARPKSDFLASTDTWFRPASLATGPNGALYIADMYRLWVEHPKFLPEAIAKQMDWRAGDDRGRVWRIVPKNGNPNVGTFTPPGTTDEMVKMLSDPNGWRRSLAQRLLIEQAAKDAVPQLRALLGRGKSALARLHAMWTLDGLGELKATDLLSAFDDSSAYVRRDAANLSAGFLKESSLTIESLAKLAEDRDPRVRFQVALAAGESNDSQSTDLLTELALRDGDEPWFTTAILTSVKEKAGAVLAAMVKRAPRDSKLNPNQSVLSIQHKMLIRKLATSVGARGDLEELELIFDLVAGQSNTGRWWQTELLTGLAIGLPRHRGALGRTNLAKLLKNPPEALAECVVPLNALLDQNRRIAMDSSFSIDDRVAAIELLAYQPFDSSATVFEQLLAIGQPVELQSACLAAMRNVGGSAAKIVLDRWPKLGSSVRPDALNLLLRRVDTTIQTLQAMQSGTINPAVVDIDRRILLLQHRDATIQSLATKLFGGSVSPNRRDVTKRYSPALTMQASAESGRKIFDQNCSKCHRKDGRGFEVGPDISDVRNRSRDALLHDILDPNQKIEPQFTAYIVQTDEGQFFNGLMVAETAETVVLRLAGNQRQIIPRDEIEEIRASGKSLMPEGVEKEITVQQMADLLEYLSSPSSEPFAQLDLAERPPNIVLIVCDNLGYADVEPFGSKLHRTPNLNQLAAEGMMFTHFYSASGVCTPSRAAIMTGCYPKRVSMDLTDGAVLRPISKIGLHPDELTVAELLKSGGYATAVFGKWHLGDQPEFLPTRQGFDVYLGIPYSDDMTPRSGVDWPPLPLVKGETVVEAPTDRDLLTRRLTENAIRWIESRADEPFFLYFPQCMPGSTRAPFASDRFKGKSLNGPWGDSVEELDWSVGEIVRTLERLELTDDTLLIWTSDNGAPRRNPPQGLNQPLAGWGYSTAEGGMRVPCIMKWPGRIPPNRQCDQLTTLMDLFPTFAAVSGIAIGQNLPRDGYNILPLMEGKATNSPYSRFLYYRSNQLQALRSGQWKWYLPTNKNQGQLFDIVTDPGETRNVANQHADVVRNLKTLVDSAESDLGQGNRIGPGCRPAGQASDPKPLVLERH